jgi:hypothetical protein
MAGQPRGERAALRLRIFRIAATSYCFDARTSAHHDVIMICAEYAIG